MEEPLQITKIGTAEEIGESLRADLELMQEDLESAFHRCHARAEAYLKHLEATGGHAAPLRDFVERLDLCKETYENQSLKAAESPSRTD
jgi:hypothetical protein